MQIECFINNCESICELYLKPLSSLDVQKKWFQDGYPQGAYDKIIEGILEECEDFFEKQECQHFSGNPVFNKLYRLLGLVSDHCENLRSLKTTDKEQFLFDENWKEIRDLAGETLIQLQEFIRENRSEQKSINGQGLS